MINLGEKIELSGFKDVKPEEMIVIKKLVGNYVSKIEEKCEKFEKLTLTVKNIHKSEGSSKYELHAKLLDNGQVTSSEIIDFNLYYGISKLLQKLKSVVD